MIEINNQIEKIRSLLLAFESQKDVDKIRERVLALVPVFEEVRETGKMLIKGGLKLSARDRILSYFKSYPFIALNEREIALIAGISEWARRVRELRVQYGWKIVSGLTASQMAIENETDSDDLAFSKMRPNDYMLIDINQDRDSAYRWNLANTIRKKKTGSKEKILEYFRNNAGKRISGEELAYVAKSSEWARRIRELRTENGWPILTKMSGNPQLPIGVYVLEMDRQAPEHDRKIPEPLRRQALRRDGYRCQNCGWSHELYNRSDPRFLELHHIKHHAEKGLNELDNLKTLCNVCHDELHKIEKRLNKSLV